MNFDSILIVTYGRSGSTLLQGVLNAHEEILVRGENFNFCFNLFQAYEALKKTKKKKGFSPQNPFFGADFLDEHYFLSTAGKMVKNLLLANQIGNEQIKCHGFKEIRYDRNVKSIPEYLSFLKQIFPNPTFILNTRDKQEVIDSRIKQQWKGIVEPKQVINSLEKTETAFFDFAKENPNCCFHITYRDVVGKTERLKLLHSFLGISNSEEKIERVLALKHSYNIEQKEISNLEDNSFKMKKREKNFRIISIEDRKLAYLEKQLVDKEQKITALENSISWKITAPFRWFVGIFLKKSNKKS